MIYNDRGIRTKFSLEHGYLYLLHATMTHLLTRNEKLVHTVQSKHKAHIHWMPLHFDIESKWLLLEDKTSL
jgi:hypothetical protein